MHFVDAAWIGNIELSVGLRLVLGMAANIGVNAGRDFSGADVHSGVAESLALAGGDGHADLWMIDALRAHDLQELRFVHGVGDVFAGIGFFFVYKRTDAWHADGEVGFREFLLSELDVQAGGESVLTEIVGKPQECTKASAAETTHEGAFLRVETVWQAALVAAQMDFGIFYRIVSFLENSDEVGAAFVEIFVIGDVGWIDLDADGGEAFSGELNGFADPFHAAHTLGFAGEDEDILQTGGRNGVELFHKIVVGKGAALDLIGAIETAVDAAVVAIIGDVQRCEEGDAVAKTRAGDGLGLLCHFFNIWFGGRG